MFRRQVRGTGAILDLAETKQPQLNTRNARHIGEQASRAISEEISQ
jgi:hypothetical protein